jgi:hypothetical protein
MSEIYIHMGHTKNTFFFIHRVSDQIKYNELSFPLDSQIMNCMINESMIENDTKRCIIFTIDNLVTKATIITHINGEQLIYDDNNLSNILLKCVGALANKKDDYLIFEYDYIKGCFNTMTCDFNIDIKQKDNIMINDIIYCTTSKPI